jgi:hypothetical protein
MTQPDPLAAGLAALRDRLAAEPNLLKRMQAAHDAAALLRRFESEMCEIRDTAIRADRAAKPNRTVDQLVALTGIGRATVVNARRFNRRPEHPGLADYGA